MPEYLQRTVDAEVTELLSALPAVALQGPKAVGKTATARRLAASEHLLDAPDEFELLMGDPKRVLRGKPPVLVDEWQRLPAIWDLVRRAVDDGAPAGSYILTGSATPTDAPTHSGAGRIVPVRMRPLSLAERTAHPEAVSLGALLAGRRPDLAGATSLRLEDYAREIVRSGFPGLRGLEGRPLRAELDGYLTTILEHDIPALGYRVRDKETLRRWLTAYAAATSTSATYGAILDAASAGEADKPARSTTVPYRRVLEQLWLLDEVPAWLPTRNRFSRLATSPVHQLADPALAARLLGMDEEGLLESSPDVGATMREGTLMGSLFESLVTLSVRVAAQHNEARVGHLRTRGGTHEVDLIVERADGKIVAFEVKMARSISDEDVRHLRWLERELGPDLLDAAVITTGPEAYRRRDGIGVIPAALLDA